jgi:hypothetical protein
MGHSGRERAAVSRRVAMRQSIGLLGLGLVVFGFGCTSSNGSNGDGGGGLPDAGDGGGSVTVTTDAGDGGVIHIDRSLLTDAGTSGSLDFSNPALWVCRPGIDPNPCYGDLNATELLADGGRQLVTHARAQNPKFDCFYVYPTVLLSCNNCNMTDFSNIDYILDPLISQAALFSEICEVYAPLYRQTGFTPGGTAPADAGSAGADAGTGGVLGGPQAALALQDVRDSFQYYLKNFNHGRKFVIMGHSQGTFMLTSMMQTDVDPVPQVLSQMISTLLIGGGLTVPPDGGTVNGTFKNIPPCAKPGQTGCMIAYNSYDVTAPPGANALFGRSPDGNQIVCTNPGPLAGNSGPYTGTYFPTKIYNPLFMPDHPAPSDAGTPFVLYRDVLQGNCVMKSGRSYLEVTLLEDAGDPRGIPPYRLSGAESIGFGTHVADYNIPFEDLMNAVKQQAAVAVP